MSIEIKYPFTLPSNYTTNNAEIAGGLGLLAVQSLTLPFSQGFASDVGFTYNNVVTEFVAGVMQQKDLGLTDAQLWATYTSSIDLNVALGSLTGTPVGGASITSNKLDLTGGTVQYVDYDPDSISQQAGCGRLKYTPNYSGTPAANRTIFMVSKAIGDDDNLIFLRHTSAGQFFVIVKDQGGSDIISASLGVWNPTAGVEYELELNVDIGPGPGKTRLFVDGIQFGSDQNGTGTRSGDINLLRVGANSGGTDTSDFSVADMVYFSTVQHETNYTPGYTLTETRYEEDTILLPPFAYAGPGAISSLSSFAVIEPAGGPKYTLEGQYWNGAAWVVSNGSYVQANTSTEINTNLATLVVIGETEISAEVVFPTSNTQSSIDIMDIDYLGDGYLDGTIIPAVSISTDEIVAWLESIVETGSDTITYALEINGQLTYWDGAAWSNSDGTLAQTNTAAVITTNIATLITSQATCFPYIFLHTDTGQTTPSIDELCIGYDFDAINVPKPATTNVYGFLLDHSGNPVVGATVTMTRFVPTTSYQEQQDNVIQNAAIEAITDADGEFSFPLIPADYQFRAFNTEGTFGILKQADGTNIIVTIPLQPEINITDLITP